MGYQDALRDGIKVSEEYKTQIYFPLCFICGKEVKSWHYSSECKYICKECEEIGRLKRKQEMADKRAKERAEKGIILKPREKSQEKVQKAKTKNEAMMSRAIKRIDSISTISLFNTAIQKVQSEMDAGVVFQSTEEVLVALELSRKEISYRTQVHLGPYRADFVLDAEKVVLEVDGKLFHSAEREFKDQLRDGLIIAALGPRWEVVKITTDNINKQITHLTKAIVKAIDYRKMTREREAAFNRRSSNREKGL